jgi:adenosylcobyric acid synthase
MPAHALMVQGTASHVGKSVITAALCRLFARAGYRVAPFKAQNMSNNSFVTEAGGEMGRAQVFQAQAAGVAPHVDMNPVLLKPSADTHAQVVVLGQAVDMMDVLEYHAYQKIAYRAVKGALARLQAQYDLIVIEGAGSPAEINLRGRDIVNMKVAALAQAPVLLVGDIERGGVFASLVGTMALLTPSERRWVRGYLINKFRGDASLLTSGLDFLEKRTKRPVLGVLPYLFGLPVDEEDAVSLDAEAAPLNMEGAPLTGKAEITVGVIHLPHISNATDFAPLVQSPGVAVRYIDSPANWGTPDVVILPGTKSTVADYEWLHRQGLVTWVQQHAARGGWVIGICGGYQMLGREVRDEARVESPQGGVAGLGLLPVETVFETRKQLTQAEALCQLPGLAGARVRGYEIHQGRTLLEAGAAPAFQITRLFNASADQPDGAHLGLALFGTYLHGLFDHADFRQAYLNRLRQHKSLTPLPPHAYDTRPKDFDQLADWLRDYVDMSRLAEIVGLPLS